MFNIKDDFSLREKYEIRLKYSRLGNVPSISCPDGHNGYCSGITVTTNKSFAISDFPNELKDQIWLHCSGRGISRLLLTCREFHDSILQSSWWREQLNLGISIEPTFYANWRELYLVYLEQSISLNSEYWKRTARFPRMHSQDMICFTDGYVIILQINLILTFLVKAW